MNIKKMLTLIALMLALAMPVSALSVIDPMNMEQEYQVVTDINGEPVIGADGNPETEPVFRPVLDPSGNPVLDAFGNPVTEAAYKILWTGAEMEGDGAVEGDGCIKAQTAGGSTNLVFTPSDPAQYDYSSYGSKYAFSFWFYTEAPELITSAKLQVEDEDGAESKWSFKEQIQNVGWNRIVCASEDASMDYANRQSIGKMSFSLVSSGTNLYKFDYLRVGSYWDFGIGSVAIDTTSSTYQMLASCDEDSVQVVTGEYEFLEMIEGSACLVSQRSLDGNAVTLKFPRAVNMSGWDEDGWIYFWLWIDCSGSEVSDLYLLLSSASDPTARACGFDLSGVELFRGWNEILLPISLIQQQLGSDGKTCDMSRIDCVSVRTMQTDLSFRIDAMQVGRGEDFVGTSSIEKEDGQTDPVDTDAPQTNPIETDPPATQAPLTSAPDTDPAQSETTGVTEGNRQDTQAAEETEEEKQSNVVKTVVIVFVAFVLLIVVILIAVLIDFKNRMPKSRRGKGKGRSSRSKRK